MTIPSRSAPPVPPASAGAHLHNPAAIAGGYTPAANNIDAIMSAWTQPNSGHSSTSGNNHLQQSSSAASSAMRKKAPPPRPPLPQALTSNQQQPSQQPKNIASLTNIFRRMKTNDNRSKDLFTLPPPPKASAIKSNHQHPQPNTTTSNAAQANSTTMELISFDSPPNSPTPTQKSVSSWNSSLSFSSDLAAATTATTTSSSNNFYSSNNTSMNWTPTQEAHSESGFEDDFSNQATYDPFSPEVGTMPVYGTASSSAYAAASSSAVLSTHGWSADFLDPLCNGKSLLAPEPVVSMPTIIRPVFKTSTAAPKPMSSAPSWSAHRATSTAAASSATTTTTSNPTIQANKRVVSSVNRRRESYAMVLYQFDALQEGDLSLVPNEKVILLNQINEDWFYGRDERGVEGMLPTSYVDIKVPLPVEVVDLPASPSATESSASSTAAAAARPARALYTFTAQTADDLTIEEGEVVGVLHAINDDWWFGETRNGRQGQFPAAYVELL